MTIETEKLRLLRRKHSLESLEQSKAPDLILNEARIMFNETVEFLKKENFDALNYLNSKEGKIDYFIFCVDSDQTDQCHDRCGRCHHFILLDSNKTDEYMSCGLKKFDNIVCNDFEDSGFDFSERLMKFSINRCWSCEHCKSKKQGIMGEPDMQCEFNYNRIKIYCEFFEKSFNDVNKTNA